MRKILTGCRLLVNLLRYKRYEQLMRKTEEYRGKMQRINSDVALFKKHFRYYQTIFNRLALKRYYVHPIVDNKVVFMCYEAGQYTCSPKAVSEYLLEKYKKDLDIVWVFEKPSRFKRLTEQGIRTVKYKSSQYYKEVLSAKVFLYNMRIPEELPFRKEQFVISTGHGGGSYKKLLLDLPGISKKEIKLIKMTAANTDLFISSSTEYTRNVVRGGYNYSGEVMECGLPRNDVLIKKDLSMRKQVRAYYDLDQNVKIILYAPTYRKGTRRANDYSFDAEAAKQAAQSRFGGEWIVIYRLHHFINNSFMATICRNGIIDATYYTDMQDLIIASDILITDYSSSVWDYSLTGKPCFLYATDIDEYLKKQGFYLSVYEWPFPLGTSNQELVDQILQFDEAKYMAGIKNHHDTLGIRESGEAALLIGDRIHQECMGGEAI